jgi:hypothetical protein
MRQYDIFFNLNLITAVYNNILDISYHFFTSPMDALRSAVAENQHDLLKTKVENNTIIKIRNYKIN